MSALPEENVFILDESQNAVVELLTDLLNRARAGEIIMVAGAYLTNEGGLGAARAGAVDTINDAYGIVGGLEGVKHDILAHVQCAVNRAGEVS